MTTHITSLSTHTAEGPEGASAATGWIAHIAEFTRLFLQAAFNPYRPEQHYMRGPGPACAAKLRARPNS
jgi:hypothetical protein